MDPDTIELIQHAWAEGTRKGYRSHLNRWIQYCIKQKIDFVDPSYGQACRYLTKYQATGVSYSAVNQARCALSLVLPRFEAETFGKNIEVSQIVRAVWKKRPPEPKYTQFWDVSKVFDLIHEWGENKTLSIEKLTKKLAMLLLLVTSQRCNTILELCVNRCDYDNEVVIFRLNKLLKSAKLGEPLGSITLKPYDKKPNLCVVRTLKRYIRKTKNVRGSENQMLLSYASNKKLCHGTLSKYLKDVLTKAGIEANKYGAHTARGSSASAMTETVRNNPNISQELKTRQINDILAHVGWKSYETFARHYNMPIQHDDNVAAHLLDTFG